MPAELTHYETDFHKNETQRHETFSYNTINVIFKSIVQILLCVNILLIEQTFIGRVNNSNITKFNALKLIH